MPSRRRESRRAKALGAIQEPELQDQIIRLLYDPEPEVVRETIAAIRSVASARDGFNPMYVPTLISLSPRSADSRRMRVKPWWHSANPGHPSSGAFHGRPRRAHLGADERFPRVSPGSELRRQPQLSSTRSISFEDRFHAS